MFGWIEHIFSSAGNAVSGAVKALVHAAIRGLYGFLHTIFGTVFKAWHDLHDGMSRLVWGQLEFIRDVYNALRNLFKIQVPRLDKRITIVNITVNNRITIINRTLNNRITATRTELIGRIASLLAWIIVHIIIPFTAKFASIFAWLGHEGAIMWHYFTNLEAFAELLFWYIVKSLESHAWDAAKLLGEFFLALLVHNLTRFARLLEDIIDAVL